MLFTSHDSIACIDLASNVFTDKGKLSLFYYPAILIGTIIKPALTLKYTNQKQRLIIYLPCKKNLTKEVFSEKINEKLFIEIINERLLDLKKNVPIEKIAPN